MRIVQLARERFVPFAFESRDGFLRGGRGVDRAGDEVGGAPVACFFEVDDAARFVGRVFDGHFAGVFEVFGTHHEVAHEGGRFLPLEVHSYQDCELVGG